MSHRIDRPFFIIGHPRSGTTLLRFMLDSHPRLYIPEETGFMPFLVKPKDVNKPLNFHEAEKILGRIGKLNYLWRDKVSDPAEFYASLAEPTLANLISGIMVERDMADSDVRWGDKTPLYIQFIPILDAIFPESQFIHVIRDGRDTALSARAKWPERSPYMDLYYLLNNWVRNVNTGRNCGKWLGIRRYHEVLYESLVTNPQGVLESVCNFLGEDYYPEMLNHTIRANQIGPGPDKHFEVLQPVSTTSIGRWKIEMTNFEKKVAERVAGHTLLSLGYELDSPGSMTFRENIQFMSYAIKFLFTDSIRSFLYKTGVLTLNRTMRKG